MNKTCPPLEALSALIDDALPADARQEVLRHSAGCPACAERLAELRALHDAFLALPPPSLEVDLGARVVARLQPGVRPVVRPAVREPRRARPGERLLALLRALSPGRFAFAPIAGATASLTMGLWLGSLLLGSEEPAAHPSAGVTLAALSLFDSVPPGNLCPRADACGPTGSSR